MNIKELIQKLKELEDIHGSNIEVCLYNGEFMEAENLNVVQSVYRSSYDDLFKEGYEDNNYLYLFNIQKTEDKDFEYIGENHYKGSEDFVTNVVKCE